MRTDDKEEALSYAEKSNAEWLLYRHWCIENNERYADNEIFVYEEDTVNGTCELIIE